MANVLLGGIVAMELFWTKTSALSARFLYMFKKDRIISERLENISTMQYKELGVLRKKGVLRIDTYSKKMDPIVGNVADVKAIWQELQKYTRREPPMQP